MRPDDPDAWKPADPPAGPEDVSPATIVAGMAVVVGVVALDTATGGLLSLMDGWPGGDDSDDRPPFVPQTPEGTAPPTMHDDGAVACTRCARAVPYASMSLNEHGYFCPTCGPSQPA